MNNGITNAKDDQARRLNIKNLDEQMKNIAVQGTGISPWEAEVLIKMIEDVYFTNPQLKEALDGQLKYHCVSAAEGAGKPLKDCQMVTVFLSLFDTEDVKGLISTDGKQQSIEVRQRRLQRITEEAKEQGGYLSQEDLSKILMCDIRTIRRDIKELKSREIVVATRGQQKDIGPGVSHRAQAIRHWLEGKEPVEVAKQIKHSLGAVENYLEKFKRVTYLYFKGFNLMETALTASISCHAAKTYLDICGEFSKKSFFKSRMEEINLVGKNYYMAEGEKKDLASLNGTKIKWRIR